MRHIGIRKDVLNMMNIKQRMLMSLLILSCCLSMTACFGTMTVAGREKQGGENAVEYVKDKYGIDAKVIKTKLCEGGMFGEMSDYVDVQMQYNDKYFYVTINGNIEYDEFTGGETKEDNYMDEQIQEDAKKYIENYLGIEVENIEFNYGTYRSAPNMIAIKYEGDIENLLVQDKRVHLLISTLTEDFPEGRDMSKLGGNVRVVSYDKEFYEKYKEETTTTIPTINDNCMWINWYIEKMTSPGEKVIYQKEVTGDMTIVYKCSKEVKVSKQEVSVDKWKTEEFVNIEPLSECVNMKAKPYFSNYVYAPKNTGVVLGISYVNKEGERVYELHKPVREQDGYYCWQVYFQALENDKDIILLKVS